MLGLVPIFKHGVLGGEQPAFLIDQVMHDRHSLDRTELHASMRFDGFGLGFFRAAIIQEHAKTLACVWHRITTDCGPENLSLAPA